MSLRKLLSEAQVIFTRKQLEESNDLSKNTDSFSELPSQISKERECDKKKIENISQDYNKSKIVSSSSCDVNYFKENLKNDKKNVEKELHLRDNDNENKFKDLCVKESFNLSESTKKNYQLPKANYLTFSNPTSSKENKLPDSKKNFQTNKDLLKEDFFLLNDNFEENKNFIDAPFFVETDKFFSCQICGWISKHANFDELMAHMNTKEHMEILKNRFQGNQNDNKINISHSINEKTCKSKTPKTFGQFQKEKNKHPKNEELLKDISSSHSKNVPHSLIFQKPENFLSDKMKNFLKMVALSCIDITSENEIKCILCNKLIQFHQNCEVMMRNLATHIQSKKHISCLSNIQMSVNLMDCESSPQCTDKVETKFQDIKSLKKKDIGTNKMKQNTKDSSDNNLGEIIKFKFLCTTCNHFGSTIQDFSKHEQSLNHKLKVSKEIQNNDSQSKFYCQKCCRFIIGSQTNLIKHLSKCGSK